MSTHPHPRENVQKYPRPPALEKVAYELKVVWKAADGKEYPVASTTEGYRVLETTHPPTYYIPPQDVDQSLLEKTARSSFCEWKGAAAYFNFLAPDGGPTIQNRIWSYPKPTAGTKFAPIKDYLSFYAGSGATGGAGWKCYVDGEEVQAQEGDFYGGWVTSWLDGKMKGGPGTWGW
ncbi:hypothetical protein P7C70_g268, partial [Phenoliferia sp. Uapishka_3]